MIHYRNYTCISLLLLLYLAIAFMPCSYHLFLNLTLERNHILYDHQQFGKFLQMAEKVEKLERDRRNEILTNESEKMPYLESTTISDDFDSQPRGFPRYADYDKKQSEMS